MGIPTHGVKIVCRCPKKFVEVAIISNMLEICNPFKLGKKTMKKTVTYVSDDKKGKRYKYVPYTNSEKD